jgi:tetratricopeptide (TPR) repeat protein
MTERTWQLRAMRVAELLDETIRLYRHNFLTFVGITALLQVPMSILSTVLTAYSSQFYMTALEASLEAPGMAPSDAFLTSYLLYAGFSVLLSVLNYLVVYNLVTAALARAISNRYLGKPVSIGGAYRSILGRFWSLLGAVLLLVLINAALFVLPVLLSVAAACVGAIALLGVLPLLVWIDIRLAFITQAVVLDGRPARGALSRSWDLVKGHGWRTLGVVLLLTLFSLLIVSGPSYVVTFGMQVLGAPLPVQTVVSGVLSTVLATLYTPIRLTGMTLLYYDLRIRKEGLDLELQAVALGEGMTLPLADLEWPPADALSGGQAQAFLEEASRYHDEGDLPHAIRAYRAAAELRPSDASLHNDLGLALHQAGDLNGAIAEFWRAAELEPDHPTAHYNLALAYLDLGVPGAAGEALMTYLRLEPDPRVRAIVEADPDLAPLLRVDGRHAVKSQVAL